MLRPARAFISAREVLDCGSPLPPSSAVESARGLARSKPLARGRERRVHCRSSVLKLTWVMPRRVQRSSNCIA
jgi:hypothetical protein